MWLSGCALREALWIVLVDIMLLSGFYEEFSNSYYFVVSVFIVNQEKYDFKRKRQSFGSLKRT